MKKSICIILMTMCIMGLTGCNDKDSSVANNPQSNQSVEQNKDLSKDKDSNKTQEESKENKDTLNKGKEDVNKNKETSKSTTSTTTTTINASESIVTKDFKEISSMQITYNGSSNTYAIEKNGDFIKKVYDSILNTKGTVRNDRDESDSKFIINIVYKSGNKDVIQSTETGQLIYRIFDNKKSRICGNNSNLLNIIKNGK